MRLPILAARGAAFVRRGMRLATVGLSSEDRAAYFWSMALALSSGVMALDSAPLEPCKT